MAFLRSFSTWHGCLKLGHKRYAHVEALRSDKASAEVLGIKRILSDDALHRALIAIAETKGSRHMDAYPPKEQHPGGTGCAADTRLDRQLAASGVRCAGAAG